MSQSEGRPASGREELTAPSQRKTTSKPGFTIGYDLGVVGTWVRILMGVIASLSALTINFTSDGIGLKFLGGLVAFFVGILATYTVVYVLLAPRVLPRLNPWVSTMVFYGPVLVLPYIDGLPATFRVALSLYITISIVVVVFVRYGGCEVVGIPSLIVGRRFVVYCPWNTVDLVDKAIEDSPWSLRLQSWRVKAAGTVVAVVVIAVGGPLLGDAFRLIWFLVAAGSLLVIALGVWLGGRTHKADLAAEAITALMLFVVLPMQWNRASGAGVPPRRVINGLSPRMGGEATSLRRLPRTRANRRAPI